MEQKKELKNQAGFTLIEVIASLVLLGIMGAVAGMAIVKGVDGYVFTRANATLAEKAPLAITRLRLEFQNLTDVTNATSSSIIYSVRPGYDSSPFSRGIARVGDEIKIVNGSSLPDENTGSVLIDQVNSFTLEYYKDSTGSNSWTVSDSVLDLYAVKVELILNRIDVSGGTLTFSTIINTRRNGRYNGPINWNE
jgi:prepilin-type N-terminal cleavage/methylation domain-containing protein